MGLPGHRRTSSDKRKRSAHFALKKVMMTACAKCKKPVLPHHACKTCGWYHGREAIDTKRAAARILKQAKTEK